jgi:hypothetical protein
MVKINSKISKESHTKHQIPACLAKNYILTSKGRHHFSVIFTLFLHGKAVKNDQSLACENKLVINIKKNTKYGYFNVSQQVFLKYRIADDFVYVVTLIKKISLTFSWLLYLYTFSLYENASLIRREAIDWIDQSIHWMSIYSTHHFFRNACTKSESLRFSQFSGCWLILSVYIIMSFDFPFVRLFGVRLCYFMFFY